MAQTLSPSQEQRSIWSILTSNRKIMTWEITGIFFTNIVGGSLHFAFELSNYNRAVAFFASVNESTWEHLKFYFWAALLWALIEYTYVKNDARNYSFAKGMNLLITPLVICATFYGYLAFTLPIYGKGFLAADIATGVIGVIVGHIISSYYMQRENLGISLRNRGLAIIAVLTIMFSTFTYFPPQFFLFENYNGYEYQGEYGILDEYTPFFDRSGLPEE
ncbi:MAG: DUF6512 family protein [Chloroflexota bacterium]